MATKHSRTKENRGDSDGDSEKFTFASDLQERLYTQFKNEEFCDIEIAVEGRIFKAHKNVLVASSRYFESLYSSNMSESRNNYVSLECTSHGAMGKLMEFMYTGSIDITPSDVEEILEGADHLLLEQVKKYCESFLKKRVNDSSCLRLKCIADRFGLASLARCAKNFIEEHVHSVLTNEATVGISFESLKELVSNEEIKVEDEKDVFDLIIKWTKHDRDKRMDFFSELFEQVRLCQVSSAFVMDHIEKEDLVKESPLCQDLINQWMRHQMKPPGSQSREHAPAFLRPRQGSLVDVVVLVLGQTPTRPNHEGIFNPAYVYVIEEDRWVLLPHDICGLSGHAVSAVGKNSYVIAGGCILHSGLMRDTVRECLVEAWHQPISRVLRHMSEEKKDLALEKVGTTLYLLGGVDKNGHDLDKVESVDLKGRFPRLKTHARMNIRCREPVVLQHRQSLYVLGGESAGDLKGFQEYRVLTDSWISLDPPNIPSYARITAEVLDDNIHILGDDIHKIYDLKERTWLEGDSPIPELTPFIMPSNPISAKGSPHHTDYSQIMLGGEVYRFGGMQNGQVLRVAMRFGKVTKRWQYLTPPPVPFMLAQCCRLKIPHSVLEVVPTLDDSTA